MPTTTIVCLCPSTHILLVSLGITLAILLHYESNIFTYMYVHIYTYIPHIYLSVLSNYTTHCDYPLRCANKFSYFRLKHCQTLIQSNVLCRWNSTLNWVLWLQLPYSKSQRVRCARNHLPPPDSAGPRLQGTPVDAVATPSQYTRLRLFQFDEFNFDSFSETQLK